MRDTSQEVIGLAEGLQGEADGELVVMGLDLAGPSLTVAATEDGAEVEYGFSRSDLSAIADVVASEDEEELEDLIARLNRRLSG